jgi:hypothetical protein
VMFTGDCIISASRQNRLFGQLFVPLDWQGRVFDCHSRHR